MSSVKKVCDSLLNCREEKVKLFEKKNYTIQECKACGHRFTEVVNGENHLRAVYSDDYFYGGKDGYPNYLEGKDTLSGTGSRYAKIVKKYTEGREVLDVGCAAGFILKGFEKEGWNCHGVEPNDGMASYGRNELKLDIQTGSLESYKTQQQFDLVNLIQVIGHFYDIDKALGNVSGLVKPGGLVLVESWNMKSFIAKVMGKGWQEYSPPSVVHWFSDKTLKELFRYYGFELIRKGRPTKKIKGKHAISLINEKSPKFLLKRTFFRAMSGMFGWVTVPYPPVDLKWYLFKKIK